MIALALALAGATPAAGLFTAADARHIRAKCHVPRSWVSFRNGDLRISPPRTASNRKIDCILGEAKNNLPTTGFVGNEVVKP